MGPVTSGVCLSKVKLRILILFFQTAQRFFEYADSAKWCTVAHFSSAENKEGFAAAILALRTKGGKYSMSSLLEYFCVVRSSLRYIGCVCVVKKMHIKLGVRMQPHKSQ